MDELRPVFIIGAGRSGTKYLRDTLFASETCTRVPYDIGYVWRYGNETLDHDEIDVGNVSDKQVAWIRKHLYKLTDKDSPRPQAGILLEKSVPNSLRPLLVSRCFPKGKIIQLIRNGYAVTESAMRMWQQPPERGYLMDKIRYFPWSNYKYGLWFIRNNFVRRKNSPPPLWGPLYSGIQDDVINYPLHIVCARQWKRCIEVAHEQLQQIPSELQLTIRYEDLMKDEEPLVEACRFIGVSPNAVVKHWEKTVGRGNDSKWRTNLSRKQIQEVGDVFDKLPAELKRFAFE